MTFENVEGARLDAIEFRTDAIGELVFDERADLAELTKTYGVF